MEQRACLRQLAQALVDRREDVVLDPLRIDRGAVDLGLGRAAEGALHLVDRTWDDNPEHERDEAEEDEEVEEEADGARHPALPEPLDRRTHRRGEDEAQEDERDDDLQLPQRERRGDDRDHDHRCERHALRHLHHDQGLFATRRKTQTRW